MEYLLAFMGALKDNFNFVLLVLVVCAAIIFVTMTLSIQRTVRRKQDYDHKMNLEQKRIDAARSIVPVTKRPTGGDEG